MRRASATPDAEYLDFIRDRASTLIGPADSPPRWDARLKAVREALARSFGRFPAVACDLAPERLGTVVRDGYAIERLTFQSRPGVRVTANLYRPEPVRGKRPAVLSVHGHWAWARMDPHVQSRCIGLARLGYVALAVDAFGAGERAIDPTSGSYHGALAGASLWPANVPLLGLQVYDNRRAVDYLLSRPDVDPNRLAITGASGGGNQSLYAGATDARLAAVVPVCGVGTFPAYLGVGCCVCELNVGGVRDASTADLLACIAPRALLVINATNDVVQFSVQEAAKSVARARSRFVELGAADKIRHLPVEGGHDYSRPMREALYGWLDRSLNGKGDGQPIAEPEVAIEDVATLRCYADGASRPRSIVTIPEFALSEGRARLADLPKAPDHRERWEAEASHLRILLDDAVSGGPPKAAAAPGAPPEIDVGEWTLRPPLGPPLRGKLFEADALPRTASALLLRHEGQATGGDPVVRLLQAAGRGVATVDLRATGRARPASSPIHGAADHNEAEWGLWIGWPLVYQWAHDALAVVRAIDRPQTARIEIVGVGPMAIVALIAAALRPDRVAGVGLIDPLVSFVAADSSPWSKIPMGLIAPGILEFADVDRLAALVAPARLVIAGGVEPTGVAATPERLKDCFAFTRIVHRLYGDDASFTTLDTSADLAAFGRALLVS